MKLILDKSVVSEKSSKQIELNKYTFLVDVNSNKIEIKSFVEKHFEVEVKSVNIMRPQRKKRRRGRITGISKQTKKAIITLASNKNEENLKKVF